MENNEWRREWKCFSLWLTLTLAVTCCFCFFCGPGYLHRPRPFVEYCSSYGCVWERRLYLLVCCVEWLWMVRVSHPCLSPDQPKPGLSHSSAEPSSQMAYIQGSQIQVILTKANQSSLLQCNSHHPAFRCQAFIWYLPTCNVKMKVAQSCLTRHSS